MNKLFSILLALVIQSAFAQVGIGTDTPHESADLELGSADKALILNRIADVSAITAPEDGMLIYDLSEECLRAYQNGNWSNCVLVSGSEPESLNYRLGGAGSDIVFDGQQTNDGGYIIAGYSDPTSANNGDQTGTFGKGDLDYWVVKTSSAGAIEWQKRYGGAGEERIRKIKQTSDGGYIITGRSDSASANTGDQTGEASKGSSDTWTVKLDVSGNIQWQKRYGGAGDDNPSSIQQTNDGGYIMALTTDPASSNTGDQIGVFGKGGTDYWIVKLNTSGTIQWQQRYGGIAGDYVSDIQQTNDGGYIVAGVSDPTSSNTGNQTGVTSRGSTDYWIVKIDSSGTIQWQKRYGGAGEDDPRDIQQTSDGGYIISGNSTATSANNGDQAGTAGKGAIDYWVVKINSSGTMQWQKRYGGTGDDNSSGIDQTSDGGYIVAGASDSTSANNGDQTGETSRGSTDYWFVKTDSSGTIQWQKRYGGAGVDKVRACQQTSNGGYMVVGFTDAASANTGDQTGETGRGGDDYWMLNLDSNGNIVQ